MILPQLSVSEALADAARLATFSRVGDVLLTNIAGHEADLVQLFDVASCWVEVPPTLDTDAVVKLLDGGATKVVIDYSGESVKPLLEVLPGDRVVLVISDVERALKAADSEPVPSSVDGLIFEVDERFLQSEAGQDAFLGALSTFPGGDVRILFRAKGTQGITPQVVLQSNEKGIDAVVPASQFGGDAIDLGAAFAACLKTDRPDGLFPTIVVDEQGVALGLCYSSKESIAEAVKTGQGVYQSRNRGLWYKGQSSGATQKLIKIDYDCDQDTLRFTVQQADPGFCHLNTRTCFGADNGISALARTLESRKTAAPEGSYTRRLFEDKTLLHSKIMEEADELVQATDKDEIAWETADLIFFALTKCVANGVSLTDVEKHLDRRAKKVVRRPGNAKPKWDLAKKEESGAVNGAQPAKPVAAVAEPPSDGRIRMRTHVFTQTSPEQQQALLLRPIIKTSEIMSRVKPIVEQVRTGGDKALLHLTATIDKVQLDTPVMKAPFPAAAMAITDDVKKAIDQAYDNIHKFHDAQLDRGVLRVETMPGVVCTRFFRPIERVGLYVPGGTAVLPSSTLMLGVPAKVAGCSEIVVATPPRKDGTVAPEVVYVADKIGATTLLIAGGAQAVAAMAYGTESVPKVDKICGPGNQYVTAAKMVAQGDSSAMVSIDMPAGPSELLVIADATSNPAYVASDLLSQAEHGTDSQVVLLTVGLNPEQIAAIENEIHTQGSALPRADIVRVSIAKSYIMQMDTVEEAMRFSNMYAPEHLILHCKDAETLVEQVMNAGSVFVGQWSPESCGDYASGTNHTLPTYGYARMYSGVNTLTFVKHITSQMLTKEGLDRLGDTVTTLAAVEGLEAHRNAVAIRLKDIRGDDAKAK